MNKKIYYVYLYRDIDGTPIYVGKGKGNRAFRHTTCDTHLGRLLRKRLKAGFIIEPEIICKDIDEEFAFFIEIETIRHYGRKDLGLGTIFNLTNGGEGASGAIQSAESNEKRSKTQINIPKSGKRAKGVPQTGKNAKGISRIKGIPQPGKNAKGIKHESVFCPHCKREGPLNAWTRYHFDNCK